MATLLSRSPRRLLGFLKPKTLLSPTLTSHSPPRDLPARIPPLGFRESGWTASPPQRQWVWDRALCTCYSDPRSSGTCDTGLAAASPDVDQASADQGAHKVAVKEGETEYLSTRDSQTSLCSKVIKIMTYNVCFLKEFRPYLRIPALADIIQHHSPDLICLQEVTPEIHAFLEKSDWWPEYKCLMSSEMEYMDRPAKKKRKKKYMEWDMVRFSSGNSYCCMQMSKLPVDSFSFVPFSNSAMGRELCMANVNIGGVTLVLATSHLESPSLVAKKHNKFEQMLHRSERVAQAKESLMLLEGSRNVIFCGDMNWDDEADGPFPLPSDGWVDVWAELKPGEDGWTYDTRANNMLHASRKKRQLRLDRFVCKLPDFNVQGIEMVGKEPIPGTEVTLRELPMRPEYPATTSGSS